MIKLNIMNKNEKLQNYIDFQNKFKRMKDIVGEWQVEYAVEKFKPLIDDGFDGNDIIEYFTVKLIDYIENKYEPTKTNEDGRK
jgi:serine protease inhibitor